MLFFMIHNQQFSRNPAYIIKARVWNSCLPMNHESCYYTVNILVYTNTILNFFWLTITSGISIKKISSTSGVAHSPFPLKMILLSESTNTFHRVAKNLQCVGNVNTSFEMFFICTLFLQLDRLFLRAGYITFSYF